MSVAGIQESKWFGCDARIYKERKGSLRNKGVGIALSQQHGETLEECESSLSAHGRDTYATPEKKETPFVVSVYAPTSKHHQSETKI